MEQVMIDTLILAILSKYPKLSVRYDQNEGTHFFFHNSPCLERHGLLKTFDEVLQMHGLDDRTDIVLCNDFYHPELSDPYITVFPEELNKGNKDETNITIAGLPLTESLEICKFEKQLEERLYKNVLLRLVKTLTTDVTPPGMSAFDNVIGMQRITVDHVKKVELSIKAILKNAGEQADSSSAGPMQYKEGSGTGCMTDKVADTKRNAIHTLKRTDNKQRKRVGCKNTRTGETD